MAKALLAILLLPLLWHPSRAFGQESFSGQHELAAGLACHRNLDLPCAQQKLEQALASFSAEGDPHYLAHVRQARMTLALIHLARDDLARAEQEFFTLLLIDPVFQLPEGDHPPKLRYVLEQARERLKKQAQPRPEVPVAKGQKDAPAEAREPVKTDISPPPTKKPVPPPEVSAPAPRREQSLWAGLDLILLFGSDAEHLESGLGAALAWRMWLSPHWGLGIRFAYGRHGLQSSERDDVLQSMALAAEGTGRLSLGPTLLEFSLGLGSQTMGTRDRYDHWYAHLYTRLALVWPARGSWALALQFQPSLLLDGKEASFFLPLGLAGAWRW